MVICMFIIYGQFQRDLRDKIGIFRVPTRHMHLLLRVPFIAYYTRVMFVDAHAK